VPISTGSALPGSLTLDRERFIRRDAPFWTRLDNNGQTSILARAGYDVNDPKRKSQFSTKGH
jgi:hypothetical protein